MRGECRRKVEWIDPMLSSVHRDIAPALTSLSGFSSPEKNLPASAEERGKSRQLLNFTSYLNVWSHFLSVNGWLFN